MRVANLSEAVKKLTGGPSPSPPLEERAGERRPFFLALDFFHSFSVAAGRRGQDCTCFLLTLFLSTAIGFAQKQSDRPVPLDPIQGEKEARALIADMLGQKPDQNTTNTGVLRIRDPESNQREIPVRFQLLITATNWLSVYETLTAAGGS